MALRAPPDPGVGRLGDAGPTECGEKTADRGDGGGNFGAKLKRLARFLADLGEDGRPGGCVGPPALDGVSVGVPERVVHRWPLTMGAAGRVDR